MTDTDLDRLERILRRTPGQAGYAAVVVRLRVACQAAENRVKELEAENFALAANQCHGGYSAENGDRRCTYRDRVEKMERGNV